MKNKQIIFTRPGVAELLDAPVADKLTRDQVRVRSVYTVISAGTERANLMGEVNISGKIEDCNDKFPRKLGYCGVGVVEDVGCEVKKVKPGDRVVTYFGKHSQFNVLPETNVFPIRYENVTDLDAALMVIAGFPAEGIRKAKLEYGESCMIVGLGILGLIGVKLAHIAGAVPVVAVDPNLERRALAMKFGADHALDPLDRNFVKQVKDLTGGKGANVMMEASGNPDALRVGLRACAPMARVTLVGCTRTPDVYDLYHDVHYPGISMIGANNFARPKFESQPGNWTAEDDTDAMLRLIAYGRMDLKPLISEIHSPAEAPEVFARLANDKNFPIGVAFDWREANE
ncbi:MAG: zinc-binding dehydrogenase [Clostridia bacterium]|nr:zinc-binding dehydrogenase [Clostridia bacterium]